MVIVIVDVVCPELMVDRKRRNAFSSKAGPHHLYVHWKQNTKLFLVLIVWDNKLNENASSSYCMIKLAFKQYANQRMHCLWCTLILIYTTTLTYYSICNRPSTILVPKCCILTFQVVIVSFTVLLCESSTRRICVTWLIIMSAKSFQPTKPRSRYGSWTQLITLIGEFRIPICLCG